MSSLPTSTSLPNPVLPLLHSGSANDHGQMEDEQFLLRAFRSFAQAAETLERSYGLLRLEVEGLRGELEESNAGLSRSLEENRGMRQHLDCILEGLPCGVLVTGDGGEMSRMNPEVRRLIAGGGNASFPVSITTFCTEVRHLLESARHQPEEAEFRVPCESDPERWLAASHASIDGVDVNGSVYILRDVSERKRFEQAQAKFQRQQALAEMSAILAHEMRNPLGSIELFAGLLAESEMEEERQGWIEQVQAGLRTLAATVNNVLHFHSLPPPERSTVDLGQLLDWAAVFFVPVARQARVELSLHTRLGGALIQATRHPLGQLLLNLARNSALDMPRPASSSPPR